MIRFLFKLILCVLLALAAGFAYLATRSGDPVYTFYEWMSPARFHQYDHLIRSVATEHYLDPMLVKAVVWRESKFDPKKNGSAGERGLMQVSEKAAREWARENKIDDFHVEKLFDPKTNLEAWTWRRCDPDADIPQKDRFPWNAEVCRFNYRALRILPATRANVASCPRAFC